MLGIKNKVLLLIRLLSLVLITLVTSCKGQETENSAKGSIEKSSKTLNENWTQKNQPLIYQNTVFPQIHSNLKGMVSEFVRIMYQDSKGIIWFGTNGDGLVRYDGKTLEKFTQKDGIGTGTAVRGIVEDKNGNIWFGTSNGLTRYDGKTFTNYSTKEGLIDNDIWAIEIDKDGIIWVGSVFMAAGFIMPAARAMGPEGGKFMRQLFNTNKYPITITIRYPYSLLITRHKLPVILAPHIPRPTY